MSQFFLFVVKSQMVPPTTLKEVRALIEPVTQDTTVEHVEIYYADRAMTEPAFAAMRKKNAHMWKEIFDEDIDVVERM